jgi:hypothetical protein
MRKTACLVVAACIALCGSPASASRFGDCKDAALAHYVAAAASVSGEGMQDAANESTACNRFLPELPR